MQVTCFPVGIALCILLHIVCAELRNSRLRSPHSGDEFSCPSSIDKCSRNEDCRVALKRLDLRCKITDGRCSAEMQDLPRCGQIMDHLFKFGFSTEECECPEDAKDCENIRRKVYENQCFVSIRHLRHHHLFPKAIDAYDKATTPLSTTRSLLTFISSSWKPTSIPNEKFFNDRNGLSKQHVDMTDLPEMKNGALSKSIFRIKTGPDIRGTLSNMHTNEHSPISDPADAEQPAQQEAGVKDNKVHYQSTRTTDSIVHQEKIRQQQKKNSKVQRHSKDSSKTDEETDYKSISIILGIMLTLFVISSLIVFLWTRTSNLLLYKGAKFIKDQRNDDEIYAGVSTHFPSSTTQNELAL